MVTAAVAVVTHAVSLEAVVVVEDMVETVEGLRLVVVVVVVAVVLLEMHPRHRKSKYQAPEYTSHIANNFLQYPYSSSPF